MWKFCAASDAGSTETPNEDLAAVSGYTVVVLDGLTSRTESGCRHGTAWYVRHLMSRILGNLPLGASEALTVAIEQTADVHRTECDLFNPATPAAAVSIVEFGRASVDYLVLSDTTVALDCISGIKIVTDTRINQSAIEERRIADSLPHGSTAKSAALIAMKKAEISVRNTEGGYWVAAADPTVVNHALTGRISADDVRRAAVLTDGAARLVTPFGVQNWKGLLDLLETSGPEGLIRATREREREDPMGIQWPRNKSSDDATAVLIGRT
jgi:hypothetical protein